MTDLTTLMAEGVCATGKTLSARQQAASELDLDPTSPCVAPAHQQLSTALEGETPRLLDERQLLPALWNEVRRVVDDPRSPGRFILTGSAAPDDDAARHLANPSLAASLLGAGVDRLLAEPETMGYLFESQVVHDLRVYAQNLGARGVFHYRDTKGRDEIDVVSEAQDGAWVGLEVKLGAAQVDAAAANLLRVAAKIERPAAALAVVIPTGIAHRRDDGVMVVPLSVLGV